MTPRVRAGWLPSSLLLLQLPGEWLSPSCEGEGQGWSWVSRGRGEKFLEGAATCFSSEQEGSGC